MPNKATEALKKSLATASTSEDKKKVNFIKIIESRPVLNLFNPYVACAIISVCLKSLFHSSQKPTRKLAASAFKYCDWMKVLAASLRVGFSDEWKRALTPGAGCSKLD